MTSGLGLPAAARCGRRRRPPSGLLRRRQRALTRHRQMPASSKPVRSATWPVGFCDLHQRRTGGARLQTTGGPLAAALRQLGPAAAPRQPLNLPFCTPAAMRHRAPSCAPGGAAPPAAPAGCLGASAAAAPPPYAAPQLWAGACSGVQRGSCGVHRLCSTGGSCRRLAMHAPCPAASPARRCRSCSSTISSYRCPVSGCTSSSARREQGGSVCVGRLGGWRLAPRAHAAAAAAAAARRRRAAGSCRRILRPCRAVRAVSSATTQKTPQPGEGRPLERASGLAYRVRRAAAAQTHRGQLCGVRPECRKEECRQSDKGRVEMPAAASAPLGSGTASSARSQAATRLLQRVRLQLSER